MKRTDILVMVGLSILYIISIFFLRGGDIWDLLLAGDLNELGDFLAGFFTPLAFGWLVYGYLLQSKELRLQREELSLTRNQLGKQTQLLQEQVAVARQGSIPRLTLRIVDSKNWWDWIMENKGGDAKDLQLVQLSNLDKRQVIHKRNTMPRNDSFQFTLEDAGSNHYEANFNSEHSERFRQRWRIGEGSYEEITHGPEPLEAEK